MGRRRSGDDVHGVVLLDKPPGLSSNQALQKVRKLFNARKAGHTGSLDPFATGMLPICLGEASKTAAFMLEAGKSYRATARLGQATATGDTEGEIILDQEIPDLDVDKILDVFVDFTGEISQVPPMYSALKFQGQPLYRLARQGITVERNARQVTIHRLDLLSWETPFLSFETDCSKGTYIRSLAEDIGIALGSCGHLQSLRRLSVEPFDARQMVSLDELELASAENRIMDYLLPLDAGLKAWSRIELDPGSAERFSHGNSLPGQTASGLLRVFGPDGVILGLGEVAADGVLRAKRVFVLDHQNTAGN